MGISRQLGKKNVSLRSPVPSDAAGQLMAFLLLKDNAAFSAIDKMVHEPVDCGNLLKT